MYALLACLLACGVLPLYRFSLEMGRQTGGGERELNPI